MHSFVRRQTRASRRLMETMRTMYGEKREFIEDMFATESEVDEEVKKNKRHRKSESASTSPDIRQRENGGVSRPVDAVTVSATKDNLNDQNDNVPKDAEEELNREMKESNPAFLKYLQFKVKMIELLS